MGTLYSLMVLSATGVLLTIAVSDRLEEHAGLAASLGLAMSLAFLFIPDPIDLPFFNDLLSQAFIVLVLTISLLASVYSHSYVETDRSRFFGLLCLFALGMAGSVTSRNFVLFYVFWEFMLIPSYLLIAHWAECPKEKALSIATKYFIFTHLGGALMVVSIVTFYMTTHTFDLAQLRFLAAHEATWGLKLACALMVAGLAFKVAIYPLHVWLPDAHSEAPAPVSAMLSGLMVHVGVYMLIRTMDLSVEIAEGLAPLLLLGGVVTLLYGGAAALVELDVKRVLAFSSISQLGYMVASLGLASTLGLVAAGLHAFSHALFKSLLFLAAGVLSHAAGSRDLRVLRGVGTDLRLHGAAFAIGALALAAIPPLNAFFTKDLIIDTALEEGRLWVAGLMMLGSALTVAYVARLLGFIYGSSYRLVEASPPSTTLPPMLALASACLLGLPLGVLLITPARWMVTLGIVESLEVRLSLFLMASTLLCALAGLALWWAYYQIGNCTAPRRLTSLLTSGLGVDYAYSWLASSFLRMSRLLSQGSEAKLRAGFLDDLPDAAMLTAKEVARTHESAFFSKASSLPLGQALRRRHPAELLRRMVDVSLALSALLTALLAASLNQAWLLAFTASLLATLAWRLVKHV